MLPIPEEGLLVYLTVLWPDEPLMVEYIKEGIFVQIFLTRVLVQDHLMLRSDGVVAVLVKS